MSYIFFCLSLFLVENRNFKFTENALYVLILQVFALRVIALFDLYYQKVVSAIFGHVVLVSEILATLFV